MIAQQIQNSEAWTYVGITWGATAVVLGGYVLLILRRGKALSKRVPEDKRRWM